MYRWRKAKCQIQKNKILLPSVLYNECCAQTFCMSVMNLYVMICRLLRSYVHNLKVSSFSHVGPNARCKLASVTFCSFKHKFTQREFRVIVPAAFHFQQFILWFLAWGPNEQLKEREKSYKVSSEKLEHRNPPSRMSMS
jgi:hypothetical protein